jgi:hypothetical protein
MDTQNTSVNPEQIKNYESGKPMLVFPETGNVYDLDSVQSEAVADAESTIWYAEETRVLDQLQERLFVEAKHELENLAQKKIVGE